MELSRAVRWFSAGVVVCAALTGLPSCRQPDERTPPDELNPRRDINLVKEDHAKELMAIPGVVGVYVGALDDRRPCIGVMVAKKTRELEQKLPAVLEGYPVRIDETGVIRPMK